MERIAVSVKEAVDLTSISRSTMYALLANGTVESVKVGGRRLVKIESLRKLVEGGNGA